MSVKPSNRPEYTENVALSCEVMVCRLLGCTDISEECAFSVVSLVVHAAHYAETLAHHLPPAVHGITSQ
jgi:hypothetical protein